MLILFLHFLSLITQKVNIENTYNEAVTDLQPFKMSPFNNRDISKIHVFHIF